MVKFPSEIDILNQIRDVKSKVESGELNVSKQLLTVLDIISCSDTTMVDTVISILKKYNTVEYNEYMDLLKKKKIKEINKKYWDKNDCQNAG